LGSVTPPPEKSCRLKNAVQPDRPQTRIEHMRIECWLTKATDTHSEYVMLVAFTRQQWWYECAATYIACLLRY